MNYSTPYHPHDTAAPTGRQPEMSFTDDTVKTDMLSLFNDERFSDVTFKFSTGVEHLHASKLVLASRSQVMHHLLSSGGKWEGSPEIRLDESIEPHTFGHLLKYMYSSTIHISYEHVHSVLLLAHRFQVAQLVEACEEYLCGNLTGESLLMNLEVAEICSLTSLKSRCTEKLQQPGLLGRLLEADSLRKIALPGLKALLSLEPLPVEEYRLFVAVVRWATAQVGEEMPDAPSPVSREASELCAPLMDLIRFPTMNGKELSKLVKPYNVVPPARYVEALEHLADVESTDDATLPRFRPRNPSSRKDIPPSSHLTTQIPQPSYHPAPPAPLVEAHPIPSSSPIRALPTVTQLGASPWTHAASYGTPSRYLPRSAASTSAI